MNATLSLLKPNNFFENFNFKQTGKFLLLAAVLAQVGLTVVRYDEIVFYADTQNELSNTDSTRDTIENFSKAKKTNDQQEIIKSFVKLKELKNSGADLLAADFILRANTNNKIASKTVNYMPDEDVFARVTPETRNTLNEIYKATWQTASSEDKKLVESIFNCKAYDLSCTLLSPWKKSILESVDNMRMKNEIRYYNFTHLEDYQNWYDTPYLKTSKLSAQNTEDWYDNNPGKLHVK